MHSRTKEKHLVWHWAMTPYTSTNICWLCSGRCWHAIVYEKWLELGPSHEFCTLHYLCLSSRLTSSQPLWAFQPVTVVLVTLGLYPVTSQAIFMCRLLLWLRFLTSSHARLLHHVSQSVDAVWIDRIDACFCHPLEGGRSPLFVYLYPGMSSCLANHCSVNKHLSACWCSYWQSGLENWVSWRLGTYRARLWADWQVCIGQI